MKDTEQMITSQERNHDGNRPVPPLTLYMHIPFCQRKCPYCAFASQEMDIIPEQRYLLAIKRELQWRRQQMERDRRPLQAIFIGGGTPSLLNPKTIAACLEQIAALWSLVEECEITLEANPESVTLAKLHAWQQMGINRLSLGIQAFDQERLDFLQRPHDLNRGRRAIQLAQQVGFDSINLDLIYATPDHTAQTWQTELTEAMAWGPQHLSCYQLSIEPGTAFFHKHQQSSLNLADESLETLLFQQTWDVLADGGWSAYEISNFARTDPTASPMVPLGRWADGREKVVCLHNRNYWSYGDYLGIGSGAHGKISTWKEGSSRLLVQRSYNAKIPETYMANLERDNPQWNHSQLTSMEAGQECLIMGLRHDEGIDRHLYYQLTGKDPFCDRNKKWHYLLEEQFVMLESNRLYLSEKGVLLADTITVSLLEGFSDQGF